MKSAYYLHYICPYVSIKSCFCETNIFVLIQDTALSIAVFCDENQWQENCKYIMNC